MPRGCNPRHQSLRPFRSPSLCTASIAKTAELANFQSNLFDGAPQDYCCFSEMKTRIAESPKARQIVICPRTDNILRAIGTFDQPPSSLSTAAAEFPTFTTVRFSRSSETPNFAAQYRTSQSSLMLMRFASCGCRFGQVVRHGQYPVGRMPITRERMQRLPGPLSWDAGVPIGTSLAALALNYLVAQWEM